MNRNACTILTACLAFFLGTVAARHPPPIECFARDLKLTDEQIGRIRRIEDDGGFRLRSRVHAVLTDEQLGKLERMRRFRGMR